ncbi:TPR repeat-containing protein YrrB [Posidoniimonas polymericola]|uniref:TPR repeat-containing protein YrrB n=1 Tax=Posidoniimonas polymericola TaxID=2528002 RepID=A0A5C5YLI4_9BACT|nr:VCBS repeat-containing protein [Posidoniimonas polymericola]TWT75706.1 TPR repeat-containing protein YrrB [Posidoniimonas polymericola]
MSRPNSKSTKWLAIVVGAAAVAAVVLATTIRSRPQASQVENGPFENDPPDREEEPSAAPDATPSIPFTNVSVSSGVDFIHRGGATGEKMLPESGGSGCGWIDYDNDGDPDLLLISGKAWPWDETTESQPGSGAMQLYQNNNGAFTDVTDAANLVADFYGQGVAIGDYDGDGDDDLYVTAVGPDHLYRNNGGVFAEVGGAASGLGDADVWTTSAGFFDYDNDGDLDLFVCSYVAWDRTRDQAATVRVPGTGLSYAHPGNFDGTHSFLYRNDAGRFTDVSAEARIHVSNAESGTPLGKALAVTFVDFDNDGWLDIFVANDTVRHFLFHNQHGKFQEVGEARGFALNAAGVSTSGMGVDAAWLYNDNRLSVAVSNFAGEMTELFTTAKDGSDCFFVDETVGAGIGWPTLNSLTFGLQFEDFDLDGRVDMLHANGHLEETISEVQPDQTYKQQSQLLWNTGARTGPVLTPIAPEEIGDLAIPIVGRATASADFDADGDLDLVITQVEGPPLVLRNDQRLGGNWLRVNLHGQAGNPHGIGAKIELVAGGVTQRRTLMPTRSYLAQSESSAFFGLGYHTKVESLTVFWPDGKSQQARVEAVNTAITVDREEASFELLANTAMAQLENTEFGAAIETLERAVRLRPDSGPALRNLARAYLLGGKPADADQQLTALPAGEANPPAGIVYLRGLAANRLSQPEQAVEYFREAVKLAPKEPTLHFQYALSLAATGKTDEAVGELEKTADLDPIHGGAQYQLAAFSRKAGKTDDFRRYMRDYQRIRKLKGAADALALEVCRYTKPEPMLQLESSAVRGAPVDLKWEASAPAGVPELLALAVVSMSDDGVYQYAGLTAESELVAFEWGADSGYQELAHTDRLFDEQPDSATLTVGNAIVDSPVRNKLQPEVGDFSEIALVTPAGGRLFRYTPDLGFTDLTTESKLKDATGTVAKWTDLDHDGDIDLCVGGPEGLTVWRNNGDKTFVNATSEFGLKDVGPCDDFIAVDLDGVNLGADLIVVGGDRPRLYRNAYGGGFAAEPETAPTWPDAHVLVADDLDNDGLPELVFFAPNKVVIADASGEVVQTLEILQTNINAAAIIDADNDGRLDLASAGNVEGEPTVCVWRNLGGRFDAQPSRIPLPKVCRDRGLQALDFANDGKTDLVALFGDGDASVLKNATPTANRQLKLVIRSYAGHPSSIGVRVQVKRERFVASRWTQAELPIEIGVDSIDKADAIQTLWPNGVARNEIGKPLSGEPLRITIIEFVRTSSCPFLYAWVDNSWQFVTDLLGAAPLNVSVARGVPMPPDPDELYVLGAIQQFADSQQRVKLRITSELREAVYLDAAHLLAVDHPTGSKVVSYDRATTSPSTGERFALVRILTPVQSAVDSTGVDCTAILAKIDGVYSSPGSLLQYPAVGYTRPHAIEFSFGDLPTDRDLSLVLTGWFRFGDSSTNIAASQRSDLAPLWPILEAAADGGEYHIVDSAIGFPTGNTKSIVCDLRGKLPANATRFRLSTSFEVRWDQIALADSVSSDSAAARAIPVKNAELHWHGFAALPQPSLDRPQVPDLTRISNRPHWFTSLEGWCTRYGQVSPLLTAVDDQIAILNSGDGVTLEFDASHLPAIADGKQRTLLLFNHGWIKEENPNSLPDRNVSPFPGSDAPDQDPENDWQAIYNTRWVPRNRFGEDHSETRGSK